MPARSEKKDKKGKKDVPYVLEPYTIYILPEMLLVDVFRNLSLEDLIRIRRVSAEWRDISKQIYPDFTKIFLFDHSSMMINYIQRRSHLYNLEMGCSNHLQNRNLSLIPNSRRKSIKTKFLVDNFRNINELVVGSPWFYDRLLMLKKWKLKSLQIFFEKQSQTQLDKLFKAIGKQTSLKRFCMFNECAGQYSRGMLYDILARLETFGLFNYKHDNINQILEVFHEKSLQHLILDNVKLSLLPRLENLKHLTYGWSDNKEQCCENQLPTLLQQIAQQIPNLESFTLTTKYSLDIFEKLLSSELYQMTTLTTLKLNILYDKKTFSRIGRPMPNIQTFHLYFIPVLELDDDFLSSLRTIFPSLKTITFHSPKHPISKDEIARIRQHFRDIELSFYLFPMV